MTGMSQVTDNIEKRRFELDVDGQTVFANYRLDNNVMFINYVESPVALRGSGAAGKLMDGVMKIAQERSYKIVPICGYAVSWINRHKEYQSLLA